jgi:hypothetical protein
LLNADESDMSDEDLYNDLDDSAIASTNTTTLKKSACAAPSEREGSSSRPKSLVEEVAALQQQLTQSMDENESLKRNMGILYRTAVAEIKRKDEEIERLQKV